MVTAAIVIHIAVCVTLVIVILLQQGKGADVGAVFGGSSQTVFGSSGAGNLLTKITWAAAATFFATSIFLAYASTRHITGSIFESRGVITHTVAPASPANKAPAHPATGGGPVSAPAVPAPTK
ncbi:MAG TPA: preprotein translocase subunit SecG [Candidatus Binataceae bacterium]|nr:preprotein translocase subunit SecG [Candidatus Binataceae bacterium]